VTDKRVLFRVFSKGTRAEGTDVRRSENWIVARRGWLRVFEDRLEMGTWVVPYDAISDATLFRLRSILGGYVLRVTTGDQMYQFGINPWALTGRRFPFPHSEQDTRVRYSRFSVAVRIAAIVSVAAWVLERCK
jgi:hypothetical protein